MADFLLNVNWSYMLYVLLATFGGGVVQTITGFGFGIFVMLFFPIFMGMTEAAGLSGLISLIHNILLAARNIKSIRWKTLIIPVAVYAVISTICIRLAKTFDVTGYRAYFGLFLIAAALFFIFLANRIRIKANAGSALICSAISGMAGGFFGASGPPIVPYYIAVAGTEKLVYLGTIQVYFALTNVATTVTRAISGMITWDTVVYVVPGFVGLIAGTKVGLLIVNRINAKTMKLLIYVFVGAAGAVMFLTNIGK